MPSFVVHSNEGLILMKNILKGFFRYGLGCDLDHLFKLWYHTEAFCFVCVEVKHPSQQFFSYVGTESQLPGYYQYFRGVKCVAQGHNTAEVGFKYIYII